MEAWLRDIVRLPQYAGQIREEGYEELAFLCDVDEVDVDALIAKIEMKAGHVTRFKGQWRKAVCTNFPV